MAKKKEQGRKPGVIAASLRYGWKPVKELKKSDLVVIALEEVRVASIKHDGSEWVISYDGSTASARIEQLYHEHDSVYAKLANG
jgi:hypothetical protein